MTASKRKALGTTTGESNTGNTASSVSSSSGENSRDAPLQNAASRKANKPLMEKRRRARINESLAVLKDMVVSEAEKKTNASKFEKADILEMTVKHLKDLCQIHSQTQALWRNGYNQCLEKTKTFLHDSGNYQVYDNLVEHLEVKHRSDNFLESSSLLSPPSTISTTEAETEDDAAALYMQFPVLDEPINLTAEAEDDDATLYIQFPVMDEPINLTLCREGSRNHSFVWRPW